METQVIKIEIGNHKTTNTYIFLGAEEIEQNHAELYCIIELPVLNPAAIPDCTRIAQAIAASFRRSYLTKTTEHSFENALAHINEELQKLASLGQTHWIGKLNAVLASKVNQTLNVATIGKVIAWILRDGEANELSSDNSLSSPLRTFENFTSGKLKLDDILIFSTSELFNYVSLERIKNLLTDSDPTTAAQEIVRILKENAGPEVGFGTIIAQQAIPTQPQAIPTIQAPIISTSGPTINSELETPPSKLKIKLSKAGYLLKQANPAKVWRKQLEKTSNWNVKNFFTANKPTVSHLGTGALKAKDAFSLAKFKSYSTTKKFFLISVVILFIALIANFFITKKVTTQTSNSSFNQAAQNIETKLSRAETLIIGGGKSDGVSLLNEAKTDIEKLPTATTDAEKTEKSTLETKLENLLAKAEGKQLVTTETVATLNDSQTLFKTDSGFASIVGGKITSWNQDTRAVKTDDINLSENPTAHTSLSSNLELLYTGTGSIIWDKTNNNVKGPFTLNMPPENEFGGLTSYVSVNKVYTINTANQQINTLTINKDDLTKPAIWGSGEVLKDAISAAVDGNLYVLTKNSILIFRQGKLSTTLPLNLQDPLSASAIINTSDTLSKIYILDRGNNRILVFTKKGQLDKYFTSKNFTNLKDFYIDEKAQTIYLLNAGELLKFSW